MEEKSEPEPKEHNLRDLLHEVSLIDKQMSGKLHRYCLDIWSE